jgi:hypothetical protein
MDPNLIEMTVTKALPVVAGTVGAGAAIIADITTDPSIASGSLFIGLVSVIAAVGGLIKVYFEAKKDAKGIAEMRREFRALYHVLTEMWQALRENRQWMRQAHSQLVDPSKLPLPPAFEQRSFDSPDFLKPFLAERADSDGEMPTYKIGKDKGR